MNQHLLNSLFIASTATVLIAQPAWSQVLEVTGVQINPTETGLEIILETEAGEELEVSPRTNGNTYIADIYDTQLRLPSGNTFRQNNPANGIGQL